MESFIDFAVLVAQLIVYALVGFCFIAMWAEVYRSKSKAVKAIYVAAVLAWAVSLWASFIAESASITFDRVVDGKIVICAWDEAMGPYGICETSSILVSKEYVELTPNEWEYVQRKLHNATK